MPARGSNGPKTMELIERAYDSAFEPRPFASLLPRLSAALAADTAHINMWVPELGGELSAANDMPEHLVRAYSAHFWRIDVWRHALERLNIPVGQAFAGNAIVPFRELAKSEMYNDALKPYGLFDTCAGRLFARGDAGAAVSLLRARGRPFYGKRDVALLGAVMPHMTRAFDMRMRFDELSRQRDGFAAYIDSAGCGALLLDSDGRIAHATPKARALLDDPDGPFRTGRGRLRTRDGGADRRLQRLFAGRQGVSAWLFERIVVELPPAHRLRIVASAFAGGLFSSANAAYVVIIESAERNLAEATKAAARIYGLTPAEAELLRELAAGRSLAEAARRLSRSLNTARNQLQNAFAKSHTHRQSELIAKVLTLPTA